MTMATSARVCEMSRRIIATRNVVVARRQGTLNISIERHDFVDVVNQAPESQALQLILLRHGSSKELLS